MKYTIQQDTRCLPDLAKLEAFGVDTSEHAICFTYEIDGVMQMAKFRYTVEKVKTPGTAKEQLMDQFSEMEPEALEISILFFVNPSEGTLTYTAEGGELKDKPTVAPKANYIERMLMARAKGMMRRKATTKKKKKRS